MTTLQAKLQTLSSDELRALLLSNQQRGRVNPADVRECLKIVRAVNAEVRRRIARFS